MPSVMALDAPKVTVTPCKPAGGTPMVTVPEIENTVVAAKFCPFLSAVNPLIGRLAGVKVKPVFVGVRLQLTLAGTAGMV